MKAIQFSFKIRCAMEVAQIVAKEISLREDGGCPHLLSIRGTVPTFHYEGGTVVKIHMVDLEQDDREDWIVTKIAIRYWETTGDEKASVVWEDEKILALREGRPWLRQVRDVKGTIAVFFNNPALEGYLSVDPDRCQEGNYSIWDEVGYHWFTTGDRERAEAEAQKILDGLLTVNTVAIFANRPAGEAYCESNPSGNYKGSGHHPFNFVTEYEYDPKNPKSHEEAIREAESHVRSLQT